MKRLPIILAVGVALAALSSHGMYRSWEPEREVGREQVLFAQLRTLIDAREEARAALAVARWGRGAPETTIGITLDSGLTDSVAVFMRAAVQRQLDSLGLSPAAPLHVHVTPALWRAAVDEPRRPGALSVTWVLPSEPAAPCRALVQLHATVVSELRLALATDLVGPCAFFARFGLPGPRVRAWLDTAHYSFAARAHPDTRTLAAEDEQRRLARRGPLPVRTLTCLIRSDSACLELLGLASRLGEARVPGDGWNLSPASTPEVVLGRLGGADYGPRIGLAEKYLMADLLAMGGPERFGAFWRSPLPVAEAFRAAYGEPVAVWMRRWLSVRYDNRPRGPRPPVAAFAMAGLAVMALLATAVDRGAARRPEAGRPRA